MSENKAPDFKVDSFPIQVGVWRNEGKEGRPYFSCKLQKRYKDDQGNWQTTANLTDRDLPLAAACLMEAWRKCRDESGECEKPKTSATF